MGNGATKGGALGLLWIHMDKLMIECGICKCIGLPTLRKNINLGQIHGRADVQINR